MRKGENQESLVTQSQGKERTPKGRRAPALTTPDSKHGAQRSSKPPGGSTGQVRELSMPVDKLLPQMKGVGWGRGRWKAKGFRDTTRYNGWPLVAS